MKRHGRPPYWLSMNYEEDACLFDHPPRQPGDLGAFRGVADGVAEEARTRGFASSPFDDFAFCRSIDNALTTNIVNSGNY